jgi:antitoxin component YwqK of YwqJK toxin-antitoxin module
MKNKPIAVLVVSLFVVGCSLDKKYILSDTLACPKGSSLQQWKDTYRNSDKIFTAIGCKDKLGNRVGFHVAWKDYGIKEHEGSFIEDKSHGEWSYYHDNGLLKARGFFKNGERAGLWDYWDIDGIYVNSKDYR